MLIILKKCTERERKQAEMSSKLRMKSKPKKTVIPFSNRHQQHLFREFHATREELLKIESVSYENGWNDGESWSNICNTISMFLALHDIEGYGSRRMLKILERANEYIKLANTGQRSMLDMAAEVKEKYRLQIDDKHMELLKRVGL